MRHLGSLALSLVVGPVVWVLMGFGFSRYIERLVLAENLSLTAIVALLALGVAGVLSAALVLPRLSPVGPALVGLMYLAAVAWAAADSSGFYDALPADVLGARFALQYPAQGMAIPLAVVFLATLLSPRRWRGSERPATYPGAYGTPAGPYPQPPPAGYPGAAPYPPPGGGYPGAPPTTLGAPVTGTGYPAAPPTSGPPAPGTHHPGAPPPWSRPPAPAAGASFEATAVLTPPQAAPPPAGAPSDATVMLTPPPQPPGSLSENTTVITPPPQPDSSELTTRIVPPASGLDDPTSRLEPSVRPGDEETDRLQGSTGPAEEPTRRPYGDPPDPDATRRM